MIRTRNYLFLVYPSCDDYVYIKMLLHDKIELYGVRGYVSPLHTEPGSKPHFHVCVMFPSVKSYTQYVNFCINLNEELGIFANAVCAPENIAYCYDVSGVLKYFIHENNPTKIQYSRDDILCIGCDLPSSDDKVSRFPAHKLYLLYEDFVAQGFRGYNCFCRYLYNNLSHEEFDAIFKYSSYVSMIKGLF